MGKAKVKVEWKVAPDMDSVIDGIKKHLQKSEVCRHLVAAGKEGLLAVRAILDAKIRLLDELASPPEEEEQQGEEPAARRIEVE